MLDSESGMGTISGLDGLPRFNGAREPTHSALRFQSALPKPDSVRSSSGRRLLRMANPRRVAPRSTGRGVALSDIEGAPKSHAPMSPCTKTAPRTHMDTIDWKEIIRAFENRKRYPVITAEILGAIPKDDLEQALIDHVVDVRIGTRKDEEYEIVSGLSAGFRMVYTTWWLEAEVNNGGFNQYFWNSAGRFAKEALAGFERLGATEHAALVAEAIAIEAEERSAQQKHKDAGTVEAFSESYETSRLGALDERFYALSLGDLRVRYIQSHPAEFLGP